MQAIKVIIIIIMITYKIQIFCPIMVNVFCKALAVVFDNVDICTV
ncbi:MAG: hypothetical protein K0S91_314 [Nitrososphaeraceae archaeon]|jgi:hypothetical protein|nr:hypothetical protein [Nitrososphaeraceae archaeon]